jgi:hypothetical protein
MDMSLCCLPPAADVEDITSKTGSFKKFSIFVRMLQSAVLQQSDSVFVDLLTCQDLELLKAKKAAAAAVHGDAAAQQQQPRQLPPGIASKRYLILTYASEFDRVHYPLPLLADEQPDPARFKAVIAGLRQQLAAVQAGLPAPHLLQPQGGQQLLLGGPRGRSRAGAQVSCRQKCWGTGLSTPCMQRGMLPGLSGICQRTVLYNELLLCFT